MNTLKVGDPIKVTLMEQPGVTAADIESFDVCTTHSLVSVDLEKIVVRETYDGGLIGEENIYPLNITGDEKVYSFDNGFLFKVEKLNT